MKLIKDFALLIFLAIIVVLIIVVYFLTKSNLQVANTTAVVTQMQSLNRLETADFTIEKIISVGTSGNALQQFLFGDKLLLIAHGNVVAGIDMNKVTANNVHVNSKSVTMILPAPQILETSLDESKTSVFDRQTGILNKGSVTLESQARQIAQTDIKQAACQEGILTVASTNAKKQLTALLRSLGFTTITINIPQGKC